MKRPDLVALTVVGLAVLTYSHVKASDGARCDLIRVEAWELDYAETLCKNHDGISSLLIGYSQNFAECVDGKMYSMNMAISKNEEEK